MSSRSNESQPYTVPEAAEVLRVPESTLYAQCRGGRIPELRPYRIGKAWRLPRALVDAMAQGVAA